MKGKKTTLIPLMFELGRMLKSEISRDGSPLPSFLHMETIRFIQSRTETGLTPSMSDIAEYLKVAPPTATVLINTLVKDGLLKRVGDPDDRRRVRLAISAKGLKLIAEMSALREKAFERVFDSLSDADYRDLTRILTNIIHSSDLKS